VKSTATNNKRLRKIAIKK